VLIQTNGATLGSARVRAVGGSGGTCTCGDSVSGGTGGAGRISVKGAGVTGTTTPAFIGG
jgi:hypothetical protein